MTSLVPLMHAQQMLVAGSMTEIVETWLAMSSVWAHRHSSTSIGKVLSVALYSLWSGLVLLLQ